MIVTSDFQMCLVNSRLAQSSDVYAIVNPFVPYNASTNQTNFLLLTFDAN